MAADDLPHERLRAMTMHHQATSSTRSLVLRPTLIVGLTALLLGITAQMIAHRTGVVFAFWDAQAHLDIARRVHDSTTPGLQMLGTVWLPVPHLLLLPFTLIDAWWWNGLAGGLLGLGAFVLTAVSLHDLLRRLHADPLVAGLGTALLLLNPSFLYLQTTAMTEPLLLAFLTTALAGLARWREHDAPRTLLWSGIWLALAVGTRYDGWFVGVCIAPWLIWQARRMGRPVIGTLWRFAWPSLLFALLWLGYNAWYFGDPLEFQRGIWSAQSQQATLAAQGLLPTKGNLLGSFTTYLGAAALSSGWLLLPLGLFGVLATARRAGIGLVLLLLAALPFNVLALWAGQSTIALPWAVVGTGTTNLRYGVMLLPGLAAATALLISWALQRWPGARRGMLLASGGVLLGQMVLWGLGWPSQAGALREGLAIRDGDVRQQHASDWLADHYDGGRILIDEVVNVSPRTRIPIRARIYHWSWEMGPRALSAPEQEVDWVLVDQRHDQGVVRQAMTARPVMVERFERVFEEAGLEIWRRR